MLKFIYGVMGSSKSAQALITEYNYSHNKYNVLLLKSSIDTRDNVVKSRIGLSKECIIFNPNTDLLYIYDIFKKSENINKDYKNIIIVDEAQFCTKEQIEELQYLSQYIDVLCYGLLTNFKTELFEGSKRLIEIADSCEQIHHICNCGKQATINALFEGSKLVTEGNEIHIGDTEYQAMCYTCWSTLNKLKES